MPIACKYCYSNVFQLNKKSLLKTIRNYTIFNTYFILFSDDLCNNRLKAIENRFFVSRELKKDYKYVLLFAQTLCHFNCLKLHFPSNAQNTYSNTKKEPLNVIISGRLLDWARISFICLLRKRCKQKLLIRNFVTSDLSSFKCYIVTTA